MVQGKILSYSKGLFWVFMVLYVGSFILLLGLMAYWHINPTDFGNVDITSGFEAGFGVSRITFSPENIPPRAIVLSEISYAMAWWLILRNTLFFVLGLLILLRIRSILQSFQSLQLFYETNIQHLRQIGQLFLIIAGLSFINFYAAEGDVQIDLTLPLASLLAAAGGFLMSEVFREGYALAEDQKSIV